ncbi:hypothetical protein [Bradyrhizobium sp. ORS 375]|uniref:phosphorylase family protein n=1 Tax=Bradyrhizobium sp. (strain ORS 375) TaxID=566679 RepID=UPI00158501CE|nr:hypothetical protein [Bradyrhizobium sp. ORS 375]
MEFLQTSGSDGGVTICVALELESQIARRHFVPLSRVEPWAQSLECLSATRIRGLVSLGLAGGLCDEVSLGDVVVASAVVFNGQCFPTDDRWADGVLSEMSSAIYAPIAGADVAVTSAGARRELSRRSGAVAVDMESHSIARWAATNKIPFLAIRVVMDDVGRRVPEAAVSCVSSAGQTSPVRLCGLVMRRPLDALAILRLCADWPQARRSLHGCCLALASPGTAAEPKSATRT